MNQIEIINGLLSLISVLKVELRVQEEFPIEAEARKYVNNLQDFQKSINENLEKIFSMPPLPKIFQETKDEAPNAHN